MDSERVSNLVIPVAIALQPVSRKMRPRLVSAIRRQRLAGSRMNVEARRAGMAHFRHFLAASLQSLQS